MSTDQPVTSLMALLRSCTAEERNRLATLADTNVNYLYSLAGCHRKQPAVQLALAIEDASKMLNKQTKGRTPIITARDIATMCDVSGFVG